MSLVFSPFSDLLSSNFFSYSKLYNDTLGFSDLLSITSEIELGLGFNYISSLLEDFRVDPMIYFDSSKFKSIKKNQKYN
jgi:hypothetical protein